MTWQLRDPALRAALEELIRRGGDRIAFVGAVGAQIHIAHAVGLDKAGPPAAAVECVTFRDLDLPERVGPVPIRRVAACGFEASIEADRELVEIDGLRLPVASPEHVLGTTLAAPELGPNGRWAAFALMRVLQERGLDLEEVRGFVKRSDDPERETLLHELAYLAA